MARQHAQELAGPLRFARLLRGMTLVEVAREVGMSAATLSQTERGLRDLRDDERKKLAEVLDVAESALEPAPETVEAQP